MTAHASATSARAPTDRTETAIDRGLDVLAEKQHKTGSWKGDYGGPLFLLPLYVFTLYAIDESPSEKLREGVERYFRNHQNDDGGWGLDVEGKSLVFTSVIVYVALRLLGVPKDDEGLARARLWFLRHGGAAASASWGKQMLAVIGLYSYEGLHPVPPELWLLPKALPIHPSRLWCHCRMVYLPMSWLWGKRAALPMTDLLSAIREEIYEVPYAQVDWNAAKDRVARTDAYTPRAPILAKVNRILSRYEKRPSKRLRARSCDFILDQLRAEDRNTNYLCIGPVNKLFNTLVWHFADAEAKRAGETSEVAAESVRRHKERLPDYLCHAADGIKMNGYDSSELWDTAFALQAIAATGKVDRIRSTVDRAYRYLDDNQVREDVPQRDKYFRHASKGGWPFSTREHGWPISDCTAEGLKASLILEAHGLRGIGHDRREDAAKLILSWQNEDGGWATYEQMRGPAWLEKLNPSDVFSDIMVDYSYVECTSACVQALAAFRDKYPASPLKKKIDRAIEAGKKFILAKQRSDGSWEGSWGVCFSYGTWFGTWGLRAAGVPANDPAMQAAARFLEERQRPDGSWSETIESCRQRRWVEADKGQAVQTSWAMLSLWAVGRGDGIATRRGARWLEEAQNAEGRWPDQKLTGVFNKTCAIHYDAYLRVFPVWALALVGGQ
ncbi:squalene--hopene cyclase [soil metagenome]